MAQITGVIDAPEIVRTTFRDAYMVDRLPINRVFDRIAKFDTPATPGSYVVDHYFGSPPAAQRRPNGDPLPRMGLEGVRWTTAHHNYIAGIQWDRNTSRDSVVGDLRVQAQKSAESLLRMPERIALQLMTATTDATLLPSIPNAPDGAAMFSATNGAGGDRFGVSGGNIVTGGGVASASAILSDMNKVFARRLAFLDTAGLPLYADDPNVPCVVFAPAAYFDVFNRAFNQKRIVETAGDGANTNILLDMGARITVVTSAYITGNDWFVFFEDAPTPVIYGYIKEAAREIREDETNSDRARDEQKFYLGFQESRGYGVGPAFGAIKVNNA